MLDRNIKIIVNTALSAFHSYKTKLQILMAQKSVGQDGWTTRKLKTENVGNLADQGGNQRLIERICQKPFPLYDTKRGPLYDS